MKNSTLRVKATEYKRTVNVLKEQDILNASTLVLNELAIECNLKYMIEVVTNQNVEQIYGKGLVPHKLDSLYDDLYMFEQRAGLSILPPYSRHLKRELFTTFRTYKTCRFPHEESLYLVDEEAVLTDIDVSDEISEITDNFIKKYVEKEYLSNEELDIEK